MLVVAKGGAGTQTGTAGGVGDPGAGAGCATSRSATRGSEIMAMRRSWPPQRAVEWVKPPSYGGQGPAIFGPVKACSFPPGP